MRPIQDQPAISATAKMGFLDMGLHAELNKLSNIFAQTAEGMYLPKL